MQTLSLKRSVLRELTTDELTTVAGAQRTLSVDVCLADPSNKIAVCDSLLRPCISYTCTR